MQSTGNWRITMIRVTGIALALSLALSLFGSLAMAAECPALLDFSLPPLRGGAPVNFCETYRGKVVLAVNTASRCGYTPQFKGLETLYQKYKDRGFVVLGFPSDDFKQEYSEAEKTAQVCYVNYGVTFPMFTKTQVTGDGANPFFKRLAAGTGTEPAWNFYKYLIDNRGLVREAYASKVAPESTELQRAIEALLPPESTSAAH
jgi:glutathione peroxidase